MKNCMRIMNVPMSGSWSAFIKICIGSCDRVTCDTCSEMCNGQPSVDTLYNIVACKAGFAFNLIPRLGGAGKEP